MPSDATKVCDMHVKKKKYDEWDIKSAADSLIRAQEIRQDKVLYPLAKKALAAKVKAANDAARVAKVTAGLHKVLPEGE